MLSEVWWQALLSNFWNIELEKAIYFLRGWKLTLVFYYCKCVWVLSGDNKLHGHFFASAIKAQLFNVTCTVYRPHPVDRHIQWIEQGIAVVVKCHLFLMYTPCYLPHMPL